MKKQLKKITLTLTIMAGIVLLAAVSPTEQPQKQICRDYQGKTVCYNL